MEGEIGAPLALMLLSSSLPDLTDAPVALLKGVFDTLACYWRSEEEEGGSDGTEVVSERQNSRLRRAISTWCSTSALTPLTLPSGQEIIGTFLEAIRCALHRSANSDDGALDAEAGEEDARCKALLARPAELAQVRRSRSGTLLQGHTLLCPNRTVLRTVVDILCSSPRVCCDCFTETCRDSWETFSFRLTAQEELSPSPSSSSSSS